MDEDLLPDRPQSRPAAGNRPLTDDPAIYDFMQHLHVIVIVGRDSQRQVIERTEFYADLRCLGCRRIVLCPNAKATMITSF